MSGAASALFLLDIKGRVLIWRDYRGDVSAVQAERFFTKLIEKEGDPQSQDPVVNDNGITYMFIQHNNVYLLIAARQNCNAASMLLFLHRVVDVFKHYFEELEEESLRDNFVVVYELLDEIMDFGYPQFTEAKILSEFIKTDAYRMEVTQRPPMAVTNAVSWRSEGIAYKKNEVFLDVVESVNILVNSNGQIIRSDVVGALKMRTYLSTATNVEIELPVPADATNPNIRTSMGSASYAPEKDALVWKIKSFPGGKEYMLRAELSLPSITSEEALPERRAPIRVKFEIPYFTVSGIQVRYLKIIEKSGYQALPWVRYITMAGEYELRVM
ncbi:AP-1 complex subunit mu-2 [Bienertia sinuspersici]